MDVELVEVVHESVRSSLDENRSFSSQSFDWVLHLEDVQVVVDVSLLSVAKDVAVPKIIAWSVGSVNDNLIRDSDDFEVAKEHWNDHREQQARQNETRGDPDSGMELTLEGEPGDGIAADFLLLAVFETATRRRIVAFLALLLFSWI